MLLHFIYIVTSVIFQYKLVRFGKIIEISTLYKNNIQVSNLFILIYNIINFFRICPLSSSFSDCSDIICLSMTAFSKNKV